MTNIDCMILLFHLLLLSNEYELADIIKKDILEKSKNRDENDQ